jgi:putative CocE/NonD family hydrolase
MPPAAILRVVASLIAFGFLLVAGCLGAQTTGYERRELTIPVRDGTKLFAVALVPRHSTERLPILLIRTPFGAATEFKNAELPDMYRELGEDGYIFVTEDIRGRGASGGTFVTSRAQNDPRSPRGTNESTDAYDTIDWLVKNLPDNNGKVGVLGTSYRGWLTARAGVGAHPAVRAISPQGPMADTWLGDDFFHQGAFRQGQAVLYSAYIEAGKEPSISGDDQYLFYLNLRTLDSIGKVTGVADQPSWRAFREHPAWDSYWQQRALQNVLTKSSVPMLFVGGFWDEEDILGPQIMYHTLEKSDQKGLNHIVLGPWFHNDWLRAGSDSLGAIKLGSNTAEYFRKNIQRPWFAYYLHGKGDGRFPDAWVFATGENKWHEFDAWPAKSAKAQNIYLQGNLRLSFDSPGISGNTNSTRYDAYVSDPGKPVPYMPLPDDGSGVHWMQLDQRFLGNRGDIVSWSSEPLKKDITIAGDVVAHLFASTTGSDADWVVKLIDVYPESGSPDPRMNGYQLIVNADVMRGRYWKAFSHATPIPANTVTRFDVDLHDQLYTFRKGHRLMVQIQSSWFPLYDRNPQTFAPNIFNAKPADYTRQEHRIWHTMQYPSHISVHVL